MEQAGFLKRKVQQYWEENIPGLDMGLSQGCPIYSKEFYVEVDKNRFQMEPYIKSLINSVADIIIKISGKEIKKKYNLSAPQGVRGRNADLTLLRNVLNWEPKISLEEGLRRTYNWILNQVKNEPKGTI